MPRQEPHSALGGWEGTEMNEPTHAEISERAYAIWEAGGRKHGYDQHDWYCARFELEHGFHRLPMRHKYLRRDLLNEVLK